MSRNTIVKDAWPDIGENVDERIDYLTVDIQNAFSGKDFYILLLLATIYYSEKNNDSFTFCYVYNIY